MRTYHVRVTLGERWCFEIGDELDVQHVDRLADIEPAARAWIARRHGGGSYRLYLIFLHARG